MTRPQARSRPPLTPRVKVWFQAPGGFGFGAGLVAILEAVERRGSIKEAAVDLGQSYRHVWARIKRAEQALGLALVETRIGGPAPRRSGLTDDARRLVSDFLDLRSRMFRALESDAPGSRPPETP